MSKLPGSPNRSRFHFGNPLRAISQKNVHIPSRLLDLLKTFDETLAGRMRKLIPKNKEDVISFEWMKVAIESVCATHNDVKDFITDVNLPIASWDEKWIEVYMEITLNLLDLCIAFSSEISKMNQGNIFIQCAVHKLTHDFPKQFIRTRSSFDNWRKTISAKNQRMENCSTPLKSLKSSLDLPKVKNSPKGQILMSAMYGMKVHTLLICSVFASVFSGSHTNIMDLDVSEFPSWANLYLELQKNVNRNLMQVLSERQVIFQELNAVDLAVKKLYPIVEGTEPTSNEDHQVCLSDLKSKSERLSCVLDVLGKDVDGFFKIILNSRDALLCGLRGSSYHKTNNSFSSNSKQQTVR